MVELDDSVNNSSNNKPHYLFGFRTRTMLIRLHCLFLCRFMSLLNMLRNGPTFIQPCMFLERYQNQCEVATHNSTYSGILQFWMVRICTVLRKVWYWNLWICWRLHVLLRGGGKCMNFYFCVFFLAVTDWPLYTKHMVLRMVTVVKCI
jgi:hypothetical protein